MIQTRTLTRDAWLAQRAGFHSQAALDHFDRGLVRCFAEDGSVQLLPPPGVYEPTARAYAPKASAVDEVSYDLRGQAPVVRAGGAKAAISASPSPEAKPKEHADAGAEVLAELGQMSEPESVVAELERVYGSGPHRAPESPTPPTPNSRGIDAVLEEAALLGGREPASADPVAEASRLGGNGAV